MKGWDEQPCRPQEKAPENGRCMEGLPSLGGIELSALAQLPNS